MPVAGGDLRQQREHRVAEVAVARDHLPRLAGEEPVRLRVVDVAARDRAGEHLEVVRVHLRVGRHHRGDVDPVVARLLVAGDDRAADAEVALVLDQLDARVGRARAPPRPCRRWSGRRRRRCGRRTAGSRGSSPRSASPRCARGRRPTPAFRRARLDATSASGRPASAGSYSSAATRPRIRPIRPATSTVLRRLRAVVFVAAARVVICGASTSFASASCCWLVVSWSVVVSSCAGGR